jgi:hypothetical protein
MLSSNISLEIANHLIKEITKTNKNCGTLVGFDWVDDNLCDMNTNLLLSDNEISSIDFDVISSFFNENNFDRVLGIRTDFDNMTNPSEKWTKMLVDSLDKKNISYDEYLIRDWPFIIPKFDVSENVFILRYGFNENNKIDYLSKYENEFSNFMENSRWKKFYKKNNDGYNKRITILCSDIGTKLITKR